MMMPFEQLFDTTGFPARWHCGQWSGLLGWAHIASDLAIWSAYFTIPCLLVLFVRKRKDVPFPKIFWLFGAFILACGTGHLIEAVIFWTPVYRLSAAVKVFTAIVSWATVLSLIPILPKAFALKTPDQLQQQLDQSVRALKESEEKAKKSAKIAELINDISEKTAASNFFEEMLQYTLEKICQTIEWPVGHVYLSVKHTNKIADQTDQQLYQVSHEPSNIWCLSNPVQFAGFKEYIMANPGIPKTGLIGRILSRGSAEWIASLAGDDMVLKRPPYVGEFPLKSAIAFPIKSQGEILAVLAFYHDEPIQPDSFFLQNIGSLSDSLSRVWERKHTADQLWLSTQKTKAILDTAVDAIITISERGIVESVNPATEKLFGFSAAEMLGKNVNMLMPDADSMNHDAYLYNYLQTGNRKVIGIGREVLAKRKDGTTFYADLSVSEINLGNSRLFTGIVHDITERKQAETQLIESNKDLEKFAYIASHDLQEPLQKVQMYCELLDRKCHDGLSEDGHKYIDRMLSATGRMRNLINDLLYYSRVHTKGKPFALINTQSLFQDVLSDLENRIKKTNGSVQLDKLPEALYGDPTQMHQLFQNLISNALKFHQEDRPPVVTVQGTLLADGMVEIVVQDNGIGFEIEYADKIFEVFQQLHGKGQYEGTGIGLSICKKIVERHGGSIRVESTVGKGSTFTLQLPCRPDVPVSKAYSVTSYMEA